AGEGQGRYLRPDPAPGRVHPLRLGDPVYRPAVTAGCPSECRVCGGGGRPAVPGPAGPVGRRGMRTAMSRPARVMTSIMVRATAKGLPAGSLTATRTEPTRAVPSDEPRLETLRDRPEISPWSASGKLDWTTLNEDVSIVPTPAPNRTSPGIHRQMPACARTRT